MNSKKAPTRRKEARQPDAGPPRMRRYTLFSVGVHALLISLFSLPIIPRERPIPADPLYEVALIKWPEPNYEPPVPTRKEIPKPKKKPEPKPPEPKQEAVPVKPVVKKEKPAPKKEEPAPKPVPEKKTEETPQEPDEPVSLGMVDQKDFKHDYYLQLVRSRLAQAWDPPAGGSGLMRTTMHFVILRDGTIIETEIVDSSKWNLYDRSAQRAIISVGKLPPLPEAYSGDRLGLTVNFRRLGDDPS